MEELDLQKRNEWQMMPMSDTFGDDGQDPKVVTEDELLVWRRQELLKIFPDESREKVEIALQQNDLTSAINYLLDNQYHCDNEDNTGKCGELANGCFLLSLKQGGTGGLRVQIFLYFSCKIINPLTGNALHCAILIHFFTCLMLDDFLIKR